MNKKVIKRLEIMTDLEDINLIKLNEFLKSLTSLFPSHLSMKLAISSACKTPTCSFLASCVATLAVTLKQDVDYSPRFSYFPQVNLDFSNKGSLMFTYFVMYSFISATDVSKDKSDAFLEYR